MPSGTRGSNAPRIDSPAKQQPDHGPRREFIPHGPSDYPTSAAPAQVDEARAALDRARGRMHSVRNGAAMRIQQHYGSHRIGLRGINRQRTRSTRWQTPPQQAAPFADGEAP
ncbi:MAG: hypothetical protein ACP5P4_10470 [Steroidobacteraceae bacterium]